MKALTPTRIAVGLGVALVALVVGLYASDNIGTDDVPEGAVASVDGDEISQEELDASLQEAASAQGLPSVPAEDDPQYELIRGQALGGLLSQKWLEGEAAERGIEASDREVEQQIQEIKTTQFQGDEEAFQRAARQSGLTTPEQINERIRLSVYETKLLEEAAGEAVTEDDLEDAYEENKSQLEQPETRNIRVVLNEDKAKVDQALAQLQNDNSEASWNKVAAEFSTDANSKDQGGVRESITPEILPQQLDEAVFAAPQGEVQGPIQTPEGYYAFQVDTVTAPNTPTLDEVSDQLRQQLEQQNQQEAQAAFISDFNEKWIELTICADSVLFERCGNFGGEAAPCPPKETVDQGDKAIEDYLGQSGCPAPVAQRSPSGPGQGAALGAQPLPQGPHPPGEGAAPTGLPGGIPGVPGGAPGAQPGGAPPGGAPQGGAPQGGAQPGTPPGG